MAEALDQKLAHIVAELEQVLDTQLPELRVLEPERTHESITANVQAMIDELGGDSASTDRVFPADAIEWVREVARHELNSGLIVDSYQLCTAHLWQVCVLPEIERLADERAEAFELVHAVGEVIFRYSREVSVSAMSLFQEERERIAMSIHQRRQQLVHTLLSSDVLAPADASQILDYPLEDAHLGLLVSSRSSGSAKHDANEMHVRVLSELCAALGAPYLVSPSGSETARAWISAREMSGKQQIIDQLRSLSREVAPGIIVSAGAFEHGLSGFRRTIRQATGVQRAMRLSSPKSTGAVFFEDAWLPAIVSEDTENARWIKNRVLGELYTLPLEDRNELLRTLKMWFALGGRARETAASLNIHRNTLSYRLRKVERVLGISLTDQSFETQAALILQDWFDN